MNGYAFMCVCTDIIIQFTIAGLADSGVSDAAALLAELRLDSCRFQVRNRGVALNIVPAACPMAIAIFMTR